METPREISESYWAAECRRDIEAVMDHYHPGGTYEDAGGLRRGPAEIRPNYVEHMHAYPGLEVTITREFPAEDWSALEFDAVFVDKAGQRYQVRGVNVVHVRDGKFVSVRSYEDPPRPL
jgi:ketosteroid isomerase-like protein